MEVLVHTCVCTHAWARMWRYLLAYSEPLSASLQAVMARSVYILVTFAHKGPSGLALIRSLSSAEWLSRDLFLSVSSRSEFSLFMHCPAITGLFSIGVFQTILAHDSYLFILNHSSSKGVKKEDKKKRGGKKREEIKPPHCWLSIDTTQLFYSSLFPFILSRALFGSSRLQIT